MVGDRPEQASFGTRRAQDGIDQGGGGGFSVGSGDANQLQRVRRMSIEIRRGGRQRFAALAHVDPGNFTWPILRCRLFAHYRSSATSDGILGKQVAVGGHTMNGHEQRCRADFSRIIRDLTNLKFALGQLRRQGDAIEQGTQGNSAGLFPLSHSVFPFSHSRLSRAFLHL